MPTSWHRGGPLGRDSDPDKNGRAAKGPRIGGDSLDTSALRYSGTDVEKVASGEIIFSHGETGGHMYIVLQGQVQIKIGEHVVDLVDPGGIFGEMALLDDNPRAGTAIAATSAVLLRLDEHQFTSLVHDSPDFAIKLLRTIVARVRKADRWARLLPDPDKTT
jgi:CRP-like cAMP-binding protein